MIVSRRRFVELSGALPLCPSWNGAAPPRLRSDHDLTLPDWGPYTKRYYGISHIPDPHAGYRFDLSVAPGFWRRTPLIPNVLWESEHYPWEASPDLSYYSARLELEWKDQVFADVAFTAIDDDTRLVEADFHNNTDAPQEVVYHLLASMNFPPPQQVATVTEGGVWIHALDYDNLAFARPRSNDGLIYNALLRAEERGAHFVGGSAIGRGFGADKGDHVSYRITLPHAFRDAVLLVRYRSSGGNSLRISGDFRGSVVTGAGPAAELPLGPLDAGVKRFQLHTGGGAQLEIEGFAVVEKGGSIQAEPRRDLPQPEMLDGPNGNSMMLKYAAAKRYYGMAWSFPKFTIHEYRNSELDIFFRFWSHAHPRRVVQGDGHGHYVNVAMGPMLLAPRTSRLISCLVCVGEIAAVRERLSRFEPAQPGGRDHRWKPVCIPAGEEYSVSQERMAATTLTNVVYPIYLRRSYIKHNSPGHFWDSLYTWDSGFIGLGLLEIDFQRALDCLNAYLTDPSDPYAAFVHHGTPIPVQIYLFQEIWNRTQSRPLLKYLYPRIARMHDYLAAKRMKSQLITTWDLFYNTGWDDYPPQAYIHGKQMTGSVATVIMTSHIIRTAKILQMAAGELGQPRDEGANIAAWTNALQTHSWDKESGYFGYVVHDANGQPSGILRHESGQNYNMGQDGAYPLVAGICTPGQQERLRRHMMSDKGLWTPIGLSTVDKSAAYYATDGYWNGPVWMPHQWFFWHALLDVGQAAEARRIAWTALDVWRREVETSFNCCEHFLVRSGRGAGWPHFSSLSAPVLSWFAAYFRAGSFTCGLDTWIVKRKSSADHKMLEVDYRMFPAQAHTASMIAVMSPGTRYEARLDGRPLRVTSPAEGILEIEVPRGGTGVHHLEVRPI